MENNKNCFICNHHFQLEVQALHFVKKDGITIIFISILLINWPSFLIQLLTAALSICVSVL